MQRRQFLSSLAVAAAAPQPRRPNILFVVADDLGLQLGCYGEKRIPTPHLDGFAAGAVRFETAYITQASCSPSRSSLFTGLYPHSTGQYGLANTGMHLHPELLQATTPAVMKKAGYHTGVVGKVHVEPEDGLVFDFDRRRQHGQTRDVSKAAGFAREFFATLKDEPFFLIMNYADPHAFRDANDPSKWYFPEQVAGVPEKPVKPSADIIFDFQQADSPYQRERTAGYLNAVQRFDTGVGMLIDELKRTGKEDNTIVVVIGDHGPPFERGKTTCYEAALRIPMLVRWPGVTRPMVSKALVSSVDLAPTFFDAAGATSPVKLHGRSLRKVLQGDTRGWRDYLAGEFHMHGANAFFPRRAIRDQRYKLIHNVLAGKAKPALGIDGDRALQASQAPRYSGSPVQAAFERYANPPEWELYDLQKDPVEFVNLAGKPEMQAIQDRLAAAMLAWRKETDDPFLEQAMIDKLSVGRIKK